MARRVFLGLVVCVLAAGAAVLHRLVFRGQPMSQQRLLYDDSLRRLRQLGLLGADDHPSIPDHLPQPEDEPLGLGFFRTFIGDEADLSNLSMPRTFFGRSEIRNVSFRNT